MKKLKMFLLVAIIALSSGFLGLTQINLNSDVKNSQSVALGLSDEIIDYDKSLVESYQLENVKGTLEESYNLNNDINIVVKNQIYDICYTCATLTMIETYLAKNYNEYYEFSPIHFATYKYIKRGSTFSGANAKGGNIYDFIEYISSKSGPVLEEEMPLVKNLDVNNEKDYYENNQDNFTKFVTINKLVNFADEASLTETNVVANRNAMKNYIKTKGSLIGNIDAANSNGESNILEYNGNYYLKKTTSSSDHMISIIGWDDNYQVNGYSNLGAWLCQNSWGENYTYFYVSYDDSNITDNVYGISDAVLNTPVNKYCNTPTETSSSWGFVTVPFGQATNFTASFSVVNVENLKGKYIKELSCGVVASGENSYIKVSFTDNPNISSNGLNLNSLTFSDAIYAKSSSLISLGDYVSGDTDLSFDCNLKVSANYMIIRYNILNMYSLNGYLYNSGDCETLTMNTFSGITSSNNSGIWHVIDSSDTPSSFMIKIDMNISAVADSIQDTFCQYSTKKEIKDNEKIIKNKTYLGNNLTFNIINPSQEIINNAESGRQDVKIYTTTRNSNNLTKTETENFNIIIDSTSLENTTQISIVPNKKLDTILPHVIEIKIGEKVYNKVFYVSSDVVSYQITYELNGGTNHTKNEQGFIEGDSSIKLYAPTKIGYVFSGWTDSLGNNLSGTTGEDENGKYLEISLENQDISVYASWALADAKISISPAPTIDVGSEEQLICFDYDGTNHIVTIEVEHGIKDNLTIEYAWYYSNSFSVNDSDYNDYTAGTNSSYITLKNVDQSWHMYCKVTISDGNETKVYTTQRFYVKINPQTFNIRWSESEFNYDQTKHSVKLVGTENYSSILTVSQYTNNEATNAGSYTATVTLNFSNKNYILPEGIESHEWKINKAKLVLNIKDISLNSKTDFLNFDSFEYELSGTNFDNFDFNWQFKLEDTANEALKLIKINSYNINDNYEVEIKTGHLRLVEYQLHAVFNEYGISLTNDSGYILGTNLNVEAINKDDLSSEHKKFIEDKNLIVYDILSLSITDNTANTINTISIKLKPSLKDKNVKIYMIGDNGLEEVPSELKDNCLTISTSKLGQFVIVEAPQDVDTKAMIIGISIILLAGLFCCVFISLVKNHRNKKYITYSTDAH